MIIQSSRSDAEVADGRSQPPAPPSTHDALATILHELRAPLSALTVTVELMVGSLDRLDLAEARLLLERAQRSTAWLHALIENLTVAAQLEVSPLPIRWGIVDLAACFDEARHVVQPSLDRARQRIDASALAPLRVAGDPRWITQVLVNLLMNASKYGGPDATIEVGAVDQGSQARIWVKDEGPGIPSDERERIFSRYVRGSAADQSGSGGLGLGLHIVKTLVGLHHGQVGVESEPGHGALFWFTLPRQTERPPFGVIDVGSLE
jgi:signal transduction histidine kinase